MEKLLVICSKPPYPLFNGSAIRSFQMIEYLSFFYKIDLLYMVEGIPDIRLEEKMNLYCQNIYYFRINRIQSYFNVIKGLISNYDPLQVNYYFFNKIQKWITIHINDYNIVFCNNIRTAKYVRKAKIKKIIDFVDAISMNYAKAINMKKDLWHYIYKIDCSRCLKYERRLLIEFDKHFIISDIDKNYILKNSFINKDIHVIENYVDNIENIWVKQKKRNTLVFVGTMNYEPNVTAVTYFTKKIFPKLKREVQNIVFYIVGNKPSKEIERLHNNKDIIVTGFVDDVKKYIKDASIVVVPMRSGAGIQNKILEAMSMRACVITTSIGVEGLQQFNGEVVTADTENEMIDGITVLLNDINKRISIGIAAENYVKRYYSKEVLFKKFKTYLY